ncbi:MAG: hypothetical protein WA821_01480, partial [Anaerolineales bacterium]
VDMRTKYLVTLAVLVLSLLAVQPVAADTGPKPTMDFTFTQVGAGPQLTITGGTQFECEQADCSDAQPFKKLGPQHFWCDAAACHSIGYVYSPYHRLEIDFSDGKTRLSNIFQTAGFNAEYNVTIRPDDLLVEAASAPASSAPDSVSPTPSSSIFSSSSSASSASTPSLPVPSSSTPASPDSSAVASSTSTPAPSIPSTPAPSALVSSTSTPAPSAPSAPLPVYALIGAGGVCLALIVAGLLILRRKS